MATSEGIPSSIDIEFLELNDNPYLVLVEPAVRANSRLLHVLACRSQRPNGRQPKPTCIFIPPHGVRYIAE